MDKESIDILASASFESDLMHLTNLAYRDVIGHVKYVGLFDNGVESNRKSIYEMETVKVVLERTLEKVNEKLNSMYKKEDQK